MFLNFFLKMAEKYYDQNQNININLKRCIHQIKGVQCLRCVSACENKGLEYYEDKLSVNDNCIGCGNCIGICPSGAITDPLQTGPLLVIGETQEKIELFCEKAERAYGVKVKCIFNILPHQIIEAHVRTGKEITILTDKCEVCNKFSAIELDKKKQLFSRMIKDLPATICDHEKTHGRGEVSRGEFFKLLESTARGKISATTNQAEGKNLKHQLLLKILKRDKECNYSQLINGREFTKNCTICGKCSRICPVDSIAVHEKEDKVTISYKYADCVDCNRCVDNCPNNGLVLVKGKLFSHKELVGFTCSICGQFTADKICIKCKKKRKV